MPRDSFSTSLAAIVFVIAGAAAARGSTQDPPRSSPEPPPRAAADPNTLWARLIADHAHHPRARHSWKDVRAALASNPKYAATKLKLEERAMVGLVPIGENPVTQLWEFYDLRSAWDGQRHPRNIVIPEHARDGTIQVGAETGIVLVLLPGGSFHMGAQDSEEGAPGFDPLTHPAESPVVRVTLAPFLIARHEVTQAQWARLAAGTDVEEWPSVGKVGTLVRGKTVMPSNPVDRVDWTSCNTVLHTAGLTLPTEAQWEYACRAGTTTPWWPGARPEDLEGKENVLDVTGHASFAIPARTFSFDDGYVYSAPVGSFLANAFGLHDVHGNVREWCLDEKATYADPIQPGTGELLPAKKVGRHHHRGGSFFTDLPLTRSPYRNYNVPSFRADWLGVRAARRVS